MKIVVIGGTGLIGSKLVKKLKDLGHEAIAASPSKGVNTLTGEGLIEVLKGTDVVVDVANSPSFEDQAVLNFFQTSTRNLLKAEADRGVKHHIALSVVGTELLPESGYFRAKMAQENLIQASQIPYTIVRATQFFEFLGAIAESGVDGDSIRLPRAFLQPIASEDVADALLSIVLASPVQGIVEIAGPDRFRLSEIVEQYLKINKDPRKVIHDSNANYFGMKLSDTTLIPSKGSPRLGATNFKHWMESQQKT